MKCSKPQYYNYGLCTNCKLYIKSTRYNFCKALKVHINKVEYTKSQKCDRCIICKTQFPCVSKKYCIKYIKPKVKYGDYDNCH